MSIVIFLRDWKEGAARRETSNHRRVLDADNAGRRPGEIIPDLANPIAAGNTTTGE